MRALIPVLNCDGYKLDHRRQYPEGTERVYSNWTPRSSRVPGITRVMHVGLQYFLSCYLGDEYHRFFSGNVNDWADRFTRRVNKYLGPNSIGNQHIRDLHKLGYIPLEFRSVPEGTCVPLGVPMLTLEDTHDDFGWFTNYVETIMSNVLWMPCTAGTTALSARRFLESQALWTGSPLESVRFQGHNFSMRGMPGLEAACLADLGHLSSFWGTDTVPAIEFIENYYPPDADDYFIAGSVNATEHSVMCAGEEENELATINRLLDLYPTGILSVVSDTWNLWRVLTEILPQLKDRIMARDGRYVTRPDSGDPVLILTGDENAPVGSPQHLGVVALKWNLFGGTETATGHRMLDPHVSVIYGDGINSERMRAICRRLDERDFASGNVFFGMGSYWYQYVTRDTFGFAAKATHVTIKGQGKSISKRPVTDDGSKFSARGRLAVLSGSHPGQLRLVTDASPEQEAASALELTWRNGRFERFVGWDEVRKNVDAEVGRDE